MQKVDIFTVQNKTHDLMQTQEGNWQNWHILVTWNKMPSPPKSLWFANLQDWGKKKSVKASSKWLCLIHFHKKENKSSKLLPTTMPSLSSQCKRFIPLILQASLTNVQTLSLSGCLIRLGSHPTANQTESFILSNLSCPSPSSSSPHPLWPHLSDSGCAAQLPALQLTDEQTPRVRKAQSGTEILVRAQFSKVFKTAKLQLTDGQLKVFITNYCSQGQDTKLQHETLSQLIFPGNCLCAYSTLHFHVDWHILIKAYLKQSCIIRGKKKKSTTVALWTTW